MTTEIKTIDYLHGLYRTLEKTKKEKYNPEDYKWVIGYKIFHASKIREYVHPQFAVNEKQFLFGIEIEIDEVNPFTVELYEKITNKINPEEEINNYKKRKEDANRWIHI